jgi:hypothetical protein
MHPPTKPHRRPQPRIPRPLPCRSPGIPGSPRPAHQRRGHSAATDGAGWRHFLSRSGTYAPRSASTLSAGYTIEISNLANRAAGSPIPSRHTRRPALAARASRLLAQPQALPGTSLQDSFPRNTLSNQLNKTLATDPRPLRPPPTRSLACTPELLDRADRHARRLDLTRGHRAQFVPTIDTRNIVELSINSLSGMLDSMTEP